MSARQDAARRAAQHARGARRRALFAALVLLIAAALIGLAWRVLAPSGWSLWEVLLLLCLLANAPWIALAAATGLVGLVVRLRDGRAAVEPVTPITLRTAIAVCVRDEPMEAVLQPIAPLLDGLAPCGDRFVLAILSDTTDPARAAAEEAAVTAFAAARAPGAVLYRRRAENTGYKAGNVMDFLDHHAAGLDLLVLLDADSKMTPAAVLRLVRVMQAEPGLAILQSPIAGRAAAAPFGRLFNAGHRAGGQIWSLGQAWWQGDEGPFWGHNAALRIAPFRQHCRLAPLPDGSHILSHDHVEAARLHRAGWGVRVLPDTREEAGGSFESPPPNLLAFLARDRRWAAGNFQYRHLLRDRSLSRIGRFQMMQAILHYILSPLWFAMLPLAVLNAAFSAEGTPRGALIGLLLLGYAALHLPRLAGHLAALLNVRPCARGAYFRLALRESIFLLFFEPIMAFNSAMIVLGRVLGRSGGGWPAQLRAERNVPWAEAAAFLWPHTMAGLMLLGLLLAKASTTALILATPALTGLVLAIPFCVVTAAPDKN